MHRFALVINSNTGTVSLVRTFPTFASVLKELREQPYLTGSATNMGKKVADKLEADAIDGWGSVEGAKSASYESGGISSELFTIIELNDY